MLRTWVLFLLGAVLVVAAVAEVEGHVSATVWAALAGASIVCLGMGAKLVAAHQRRTQRADQPDSIEYVHAERAAATTFPFGLLILAALGSLLVFQGSYWEAVLVYCATAVLVAAYWINYIRARRRG